MTQIYITIGIIAIIAALVCYVFIKQTLNDRKQDKERLHRILVKRAKDLLQIISAFPQGYLPKEVMVFIYRTIIDAFEQLTKLNPAEAEYIEALKVHSAQLEAIIRQPESNKSIQLQSTSQINELRQYLHMLNNFLQKSLERHNITQKQYGHYKLLVKELIIKLAVNNYMISAKQATQIDKPKLAIHYYDLAKKLLIKETPANYKNLLQSIESLIQPLTQEEQKAEVDQQVITEDNEQEAQSPEDKEWAEFQEDSGWKKKNIYD